MKIKRSRNVKKIIIFTLILFEFSVVFLFTNVNFENSFSSNFKGNDEYEENPRTLDDVPGYYFHREEPTGFLAFPSIPNVYTILNPGGYTLQESVKNRDSLFAGVGNYGMGYFAVAFYGYSNFESTMHDEIRSIIIDYRIFFTYNIELDAENFVFNIICDDGTTQSIRLFDYRSGGYDIPTFEDSIKINATNFGHIFRRVKDGGYIESFSLSATVLSPEQFIYVDYIDIYYRYKPEPPFIWDYNTGAELYGSPALGDVNNDGNLDIIIGTADIGGGVSKIYAFNGESGTVLWSSETGSASFTSSPALGDIDNDGKLEVIIGCKDFRVYALNAEDGSLLWSYQTGYTVFSSPALGDVDKDGILEVVIGSEDNYLYVLNGEDGSLKWKFDTGGVMAESAALGDVDNDGELEIVIGGVYGNITALDGDSGNIEWNYQTGLIIQSSPSLGDIDGDAKLEVVIGDSEGNLYALNGESGSLKWTSDLSYGILRSCPALGNVDNDIHLEVIVGNENGSVYALNGEDGTIAWCYQTGSTVRSPPSLGDVDGDGKQEAIVGASNSYLYALNGEDGSLSWKIRTGSIFQKAPALGDVYGDDNLEVVVAVGHTLRVIQPTPSGKDIVWQGYSGDSSFHRSKVVREHQDTMRYDQLSVSNSTLQDLSVQKNFTQEWVYPWGGLDREEVSDVAVDSIGNVYVTGYTYSYGPGKADVVLIKFNISDQIEWIQYWGGDGDEKALGLAIDNNNDIYIVGYNDTSSKKDAVILKYAPDGTKIWENIWGSAQNDTLNAIVVSSSNNVYAVGYTDGFEDPNGDIVLIKQDPLVPNAKVVRRWNSGSNSKDMALDVGLDSYGNIYITGYKEDIFSGTKSLVLLKYNSDLSLLWNNVYSGGMHSFGSTLTIDDNNNVYITGGYSEFGDDLDVLIVKYSSAGSLIWDRPWGTDNDEIGKDIVFDPLGYLYIAVNQTNYLLEYKIDGSFIWSESCDVEGWEYVSSITCSDYNKYGANDLYIVGVASSDIYLIKNTLTSNCYLKQGEIIGEDDFVYTGQYRHTKGQLVSLIGGQNKQMVFELETTKNNNPDHLGAIAWASVKTPSIIDINNLANIKLDYGFDNDGEIWDNNPNSDMDEYFSHITKSLYLLKNTGNIDNYRTNSYLIRASRIPIYSSGIGDHAFLSGRAQGTIDLRSKGLNLADYIFPDGSLTFILYGELYGQLTNPSYTDMRIIQEFDIDRLNLEIIEKTYLNTQLSFSVRDLHHLTDNSNLILSLSNYVNPYSNNYFTIKDFNGFTYDTIPLPESVEPININIDVPIKLDRLAFEAYSDGRTYLDNLIFSAVYDISYDVNNIELCLEDVYIQEGILTYDGQYGYIDFGLDVSLYRGTPWKGTRVEVHMPKYSALKEFYDIQEDIFYDQFWTINRIEFPYEDDSYELLLSNGYYHPNHVLYINDTNLNENDDFNMALNPFTYRIFFDKKPLEMSLYIQNPNQDLVNELIISDPEDYSEYSLYCRIFDPSPFLGLTNVPYFMEIEESFPIVHYYIDSSFVFEGIFSESGINTQKFIWNLASGIYDFSSSLENILEPVYHTLPFFNYSYFTVFEQPYFNNTYDLGPLYMGSTLDIDVNLLNPDGIEIGQNISVFAENTYWVGHESSSISLDHLVNYSGNVYHFETGTPSSSLYLANNELAYTLLNASYPSNGLIFAPEILEYNPLTKSSEQELEVYIVLDLSELIQTHNLDPSKDFSFLKATILGASFIDTLQDLGEIEESYGRIEVYNSLLDNYEILLQDNLFDETLEHENPSNLLRLEDLSKYQFKRDYEDDIGRYIDPQNRVTFRLTSYFRGNITDPNSYLSNFDKPNAVLGALIDFVEVEMVWWKNSPELTSYTQMDYKITPSIYSFTPTAPGIYNITFEYNSEASFYYDTTKTIKIYVERCPVQISLDLTSDGFSTGTTTLTATVINQLTNTPAADAKVLFFSNNSIDEIGIALTDANGIATFVTNSLSIGDHIIWAETVPNDGKYVRPYIDTPYPLDRWALNNSLSHFLSISMSQSQLELISLAPENHNLIVEQEFLIYPKLMDTHASKEVFDENIDIFINDNFYGTFLSSKPFLLSFLEPGDYIVEGYYAGTPILNESYDSATFKAKRLLIFFSDISPEEQYMYFPNQTITITVTAFDLTTETFVSGLTINLYTNITGIIASGITNYGGNATIAMMIDEGWGGKDITIYAMNAPISSLYLERRTSDVTISVRPYNVSLSLNINETEMFVNENYEFTFNLWNEDLNKFVEDETLDIYIYKDNIIQDYFSITTVVDSTRVLAFDIVGEYSIEIVYEETTLYLRVIDTFSIEVLKRPTYISLDITDKDLVAGNEFSITVFLMDALNNESILMKHLNVYENIYDNGSFVVSKDFFEIYTGYTNTFLWAPLRAAEFEFVFSFELIDLVYQNSNYSIILSVKKRQVLIDSIINNMVFKIGDLVQINSRFIDLNTNNWDLIPGLDVRYLIQNGSNVLYSEILTTDENGIINFTWQIPLNLVNTEFNITLITATSNIYHWNFELFELSTLTIDTYFNITKIPSIINYLDEATLFNIELLSILGNTVIDLINYEINSTQLSFYSSGIIDLGISSELSVTLSDFGKYTIKFYYNGTQIYSAAQTESTIIIELRPAFLELIEYPEFIFQNQQTISLKYRLTDKSSGTLIENCMVKLYYIDFDTSTKIYLDISEITDSNGEVTFILDIPLNYPYSSLGVLAETIKTAKNDETFDSYEMEITDSPTFINLRATTDSLLFYLNDTLQISFELFDYFNNLLLSEEFVVEIITPSSNYLTTLRCNQFLTMNFTELGIYSISVLYEGNTSYLPSSAHLYYLVSPIPTSLTLLELIPDILYSDQYLYLQVQLKNNLTDIPLENELISFYLSDSAYTYPIYTNLTDANGLITFVWEVNESLIDHEIQIFAVYNYVNDYLNCSTPKFLIHISKYNVDLEILDFPELLEPFTEEHFLLRGYRNETGEVAVGCQFELNLIYPNGTRLVLLDSFSDFEGIIEFDWTPQRYIFNFKEVNFEINIIEDKVYYGGIIDTQLVSIDKIYTFLDVSADRFQVLINETVDIQFNLSNIFEEILYGELIEVTISNILYLTNFTIIIGYNDTIEFTIPNSGVFKIVGVYRGTDRNYPSWNTTLIYSDKFELEIELSILEAFTKNQTCSFVGNQWTYSILDYHKNFTLVANVSIRDYNLPMESVEVYFYFIQEAGEYILIGSNFTNNEGIAIFCWDTSNFTLPQWWKSSALMAKIPETLYNHPSESNPIYFSLRKIHTFIEIDTFTSKFRVNVDYKINITLYDEFMIKVKGFNISVNIYFKGKGVNSYKILTNGTSYFEFTPSKCGNYIIKAFFAGSEEYKACRKTENYKCVEKEPTSLRISVPNSIEPNQLYSIKIILFNSTGCLLTGELVEVTIMYHDESGETQYYYLDVIIGLNNTFDWIFPEYDEYVIKALYRGSDDYLGCKVVTQSKSLVIFTFSFWELFFLFLGPGLMIFPSFERKDKKRSKWNKKKKIITALFIIFAFLGSNYAMIASTCSQIEKTGLIGEVNIESNYNPENSDLNGMDNLFDLGTSLLNQVPLDLIPDQENSSEQYDYIIENSTIIPPEADVSPPSLSFVEIADDALLTETVILKVSAFDKESDIEKVLFKILYQGVTIIHEREFDYNETLGLYVYELNTIEYQDGDYDIYAIAIDSNSNEESIYINVEISNNPDIDTSDIETDLFIVELTDYINVSFTSLINGFFTLRIRDINLNPVTTIFGEVKENELNLLNVPIEPLYYKEGNYLIQLTVMTEIFGISAAETQDFRLIVKKESVKLELDVVEGEGIFTDHRINLRARLVENDFIILPEGDIVESEVVVPVSGKVLSFEISDSDNYQFLGRTITDSNGYATFNYKVDLNQGYHLFNVTFQGSNVYQPLESFGLFENQGKPNYILLAEEIDPVAYNNIGSISARVTGDIDAIPNVSLYFNISNSNENVYLGMAETDENGLATISFPCNHLPGIYDVIVYFDGDTVYANNMTVFEDSFEIVKESSKLKIVSDGDTYIVCPLKYETEIAAKLIINDTYVGIKDIPLIYELLYDNAPINIGTVHTDSNGFSVIQFNPSSYNLIPGTYLLAVYIDDNIHYSTVSTHIYLKISKDAPILSVEGTEVYFSEAFQLNATLTDSLLNPLMNKELNFYAVNSSDESYLYLGKAETNDSGLATLNVHENKFNSTGVFDIVVQFSGDHYEDPVYKRISNALIIHYRETKINIQGQEEQIPIKHLDIEILLTDSNYQPIEGQEIYLECYREGMTNNLLGSRISVRTNASGVALYSLPLLLPDDYILYAYYLPQSDGILKNDGYLDSEAVFKFKIVRIAADLMVKHLSKPYIMRGDILDITVVSESEAAKDYLIPVRIFLDGTEFDHVDILGLMTIKQGVGRFSYEIPLGSDFQAGIYNFTIIIEPGTFFEGNTSFSIDLRERTTLTISYIMLNPRAAGNHYIWEQEKILFTLIDEDGKPLPIQCENQFVDRLIRYQIINGQYITDIKEPGLTNGSFLILNTPKAYGDEVCIAINNGSRFFLPAYQKRVVQVFRRPLNLIYLQYTHDNPKRLDLPYTGHRGETLFVEALVQDYLNETYRPNHKINFGYNGMLKNYYAISDGNGYVKIEIPLNSESGLIQADNYNPFIKIKLTSKFQAKANYSLEELQILEFGHFECQVGGFIPKDWSYILKPKITFYDEDNKPISDYPFYIRYVKISNEVVYTKKEMKSGYTEIPVSGHGKYKIVITITSDNTGYSIDNDTIASYMISKTLISAIKKDSSIISVWSPFIRPLYIPLFSDWILPAFWKSMEWRASSITIAIWFILLVLFGTEHLEFTWLTFIKFILLIIVFEIFDTGDAFTGFMVRFGLLAGINLLYEVMTGPNWIFSIIVFLIAMATTYAIKKKLDAIYDDYQDLRTLKHKSWKKPYIIMLEFLITMGYGLYYNLKKAFGIFASPLSWVLSWLWGVKRQLEGEIAGAPHKALAFWWVVIREVVDIVINAAIPKPKPGNIFGFLIEIARTILKVTITLVLLGVFMLAFSSWSMIVTAVIAGLIDLFLYRIFEYVMPLFMDSIEVPYKGPGDDS